jgi:acetate kinase
VLLIINAGSSSLKFAVFGPGQQPARVISGKIERIGHHDARLTLLKAAPNDHGHREAAARAEPTHRAVAAPDHAACLPLVLEAIEAGGDIKAIGHRVVHGGPRYAAPVEISADVIGELKRLSPFDPEHLPAEIALIEACAKRFPNVPQIACFDTAFHHDLPRVAAMLPIPRRYEAQGVRRYGFHGLSYAYLMKEVARRFGRDRANGRVILAHLGNGASLAAVRGGKPVDTSMAFTPTAGLVMSTRSGDLDPGLVAYFTRTDGMTPEQFHRMVNEESGLHGVSETSSDVRDLLEREAADVRAAEALALFCYQVSKWIGAFAAALGGLDLLVFSGGIGENQPVIRARICAPLGFLGVAIDAPKNATNAPVISDGTRAATVCVIPTDEESEIAHSIVRTLFPAGVG